jgi:hypothetical protein
MLKEIELTDEQVSLKEKELSDKYNQKIELEQRISSLKGDIHGINGKIRMIVKDMNDSARIIRTRKLLIDCRTDFNVPDIGKKLIYNDEYNFEEVLDMTEKECDEHPEKLFKDEIDDLPETNKTDNELF